MNPAPMPVVAALYGGILALWLILLALPVARLRHERRIGLGDGGDPLLARAIRIHGNAAEWILPALVLLLMAELNRASPVLLHSCGVALVAGRVLHAWGLSRTSGSSFGRFAGASVTWIAIIVLAAFDIWAFVRLALR
jgi:uncharacterized membrane protein YecN with MAPEG domain